MLVSHLITAEFEVGLKLFHVVFEFPKFWMPTANPFSLPP